MKNPTFEVMINQPKKSVLIVMNSTGYGGLEMNTLKLVKLLNERGWEIHLAYTTETRFAQEVEALEVAKVRFSKVKKYFDFKAAKQLAQYIDANMIDKVLTVYRPDLDLIAWTKRKTNQKFTHIHQQHMQIGIPKKGWIQKMRYKAIDKWIAPLNWLKQEVIEKTIIRSEQIEVIPIGVETDKFINSSMSKKEAQQKFNCQTSDKLIGVLGRIDEKKGQLFLIQAIEELRKNGEQVSLLIVGEPTINDPKGKEYYNKVVQYINAHELKEVVYFAPFTNEVENFYQAIDVFVMSSEGETYGMVTLEALLCEVPVIGTNSGGTPEILSYAENSSLFEYNELNSFLDAYKQLGLSNEKNVRTKDHIIEHFSIEQEIKGIEQILNE